MKYIEMKGLYTFIKIIFGIIILILVWMQWDSSNRSLNNGYYIDYGSGSSILSTEDKFIFIGGILKYNYDDKYIIVKRFPRMDYSCENSIDSHFINKIQYLIIDSKKDIIFGGFDFKDFKNKKQELNIDLDFNKGNYRIMRHQFWSDYEGEKERIAYMKKFCKKNEQYPKINEF